MATCNCNLLKEPLRNLEDVHARCKASNNNIYSTLDKIRSFTDGMLAINNWLFIYRCRVCGTLFAEEFPFGEMQGGGPKCLYQIETSDLDNWLKSYVPLTPKLRKAAEDLAFFEILGEEVGPEICRHDGCTHLRIRNSVMCKQHHFEMIKHRPFSVLETAQKN